MRPRVLLLVLAVSTLLAFALGLMVGAQGAFTAELRGDVVTLRMARSATAYGAGAALAVAGVMTQGLFRNPLASPDVLGTTAGASLAGKLALLAAPSMLHVPAHGLAPELLLPLGCLLGAFGALLVLLAISRRTRDPVVLLLAGFLLSSLCLALGSLITSLAQESWELGRAVVAFALGGVSGAGPRQVALVAPLTLIGSAAALCWARPLDLLLSGEDEARVLGLDVPRARRWCIAWTALLTAGAVAVGGNLGFVGLVVPHGLRRLLGVAHRPLVPAALLGGGSFTLLCDVAVRALPSRTEVPLGVITGLVGAPLFLALVLRSRREVLYG